MAKVGVWPCGPRSHVCPQNVCVPPEFSGGHPAPRGTAFGGRILWVVRLDEGPEVDPLWTSVLAQSSGPALSPQTQREYDVREPGCAGQKSPTPVTGQFPPLERCWLFGPVCDTCHTA